MSYRNVPIYTLCPTHGFKILKKLNKGRSRVHLLDNINEGITSLGQTFRATKGSNGHITKDNGDHLFVPITAR